MQKTNRGNNVDSLIRAFAPYVKILNDLDELTSFNANNEHWGNQPSFRS